MDWHKIFIKAESCPISWGWRNKAYYERRVAAILLPRFTLLLASRRDYPQTHFAGVDRKTKRLAKSSVTIPA